MGTLHLISGLLLLLVPGTLLAFLLVSRTSTCRPALIVGYGVLIGLVGVPAIMRLVDALGLPVSFSVTGTSIAAASAILFFTALRRSASLGAADVRHSDPADLSRSGRLVFAVLLAIIALRVFSVAVDVIWRPLFPWDATMHWATKARVWFEYQELKPFVDNVIWLNSSDPGVFTDHHPEYPITIPLLQLWMASAIGVWDESLINLPWLLCLIGLAAAFYGQAREAGANPTLSLVFTYFLVSMPLLNTHIALAGYADIFLGTCYCLAIMAFHNWSVQRSRSQALLAAMFAVSCMLIKNEGAFWLLTFLPALVVVLLPGRKAALLLFGLFILAVVLLAVFPRDLVVAGHSLTELNIFYRPEALRAVGKSIFLHDNWHLFAYLLVAIFVANLVFRRRKLAVYLPVLVALMAAASLFMFLFCFTAYSGGAIGFTAVGRISLQLVPAFMFLCLLLSKELLVSEELPVS